MAVIPFRYRAGKTVLHRAPAGLKLLAVMALSTVAYVSLYGLAAAIALIIAASIAARIPPWELLKGSLMLAVMSLCVILLNLRTPVIGIITALRIFIPFAAAALLFAVTPCGNCASLWRRWRCGSKNCFQADARNRETQPFSV